MTTETDHKKALEFFKKSNPTLYNDTEQMRIKMLELEACTKNETNLPAKSIYVQGRNLLACALGVELLPEIEIPEEKEMTMDEINAIRIVPNQKITVVIVDDRPNEVQVMISVLESWPNVRVWPIIGEITQCSPRKTAGLLTERENRVSTICLLDEAIGQIKGSDVAKFLNELGFVGILASITSGEKPAFTDFHFGDKNKMAGNYFIKKFVEFINQLIREERQ